MVPALLERCPDPLDFAVVEVLVLARRLCLLSFVVQRDGWIDAATALSIHVKSGIIAQHRPIEQYIRGITSDAHNVVDAVYCGCHVVVVRVVVVVVVIVKVGLLDDACIMKRDGVATVKMVWVCPTANVKPRHPSFPNSPKPVA